MEKKYDCWLSHTCLKCTNGGRRKPRIHASSRGYEESSECDLAVVTIQAKSRNEAVLKYKKVLGE
jgi:hypothetical protein